MEAEHINSGDAGISFIPFMERLKGSVSRWVYPAVYDSLEGIAPYSEDNCVGSIRCDLEDCVFGCVISYSEHVCMLLGMLAHFSLVYALALPKPVAAERKPRVPTFFGRREYGATKQKILPAVRTSHQLTSPGKFPCWVSRALGRNMFIGEFGFKI